MKDICFWSVGDDDYAYMLKGLVHSFHAIGMEGDFIVFSDRDVKGATRYSIGNFDKRGCFFKFKFLQEHVKHWDYQHYIYIDADSLFIRKPRPLIPLLQGSPIHLFCEGDCTQPMRRKEWWGCPLEDYVKLMRDCGVVSDRIYHVNGGFFIIKREAVEVVCELAYDFARYATQKGYLLPDEPAWAYAMHMLCVDPDLHLLSTHLDVWCSDWEGVFSNGLPSGKSWIFKDYMTFEPREVNPAIVHAIKSKDFLIEYGRKFEI